MKFKLTKMSEVTDYELYKRDNIAPYHLDVFSETGQHILSKHSADKDYLIKVMNDYKKAGCKARMFERKEIRG